MQAIKRSSKKGIVLSLGLFFGLGVVPEYRLNVYRVGLFSISPTSSKRKSLVPFGEMVADKPDVFLSA